VSRAAASLPRVVLVTRPTRLEVLLAAHGTLGQAEFYVESRGQSLAPLVEQQAAFDAALREVQLGIPAAQRRTRVGREALDRFLFAPDDVVLIVGQDGLVPNTAKYLRGQLTAGINPDPLQTAALLDWAMHRNAAFRLEERVMARAQREDGQQLLALNELFIGHQTHQSARYLLAAGAERERQSSSGIICSTGTGCTGWARSIVTQRDLQSRMPTPEDARLAWFVREPWPSVATGAALNFGFVQPPGELAVYSEMGEGGTVFADGIEADRLDFLEGQSVKVSVAQHRLKLVMPGRP